ncbi:MAG: biopolymer transporter ExbD [Alphaproteobacteria bacterium]|nr:biopolymer transporter ExbD [Alphaproteobacteria bacterium]
MDFPRTTKPIRSLPLIPMIDVTFILIVFFMLTTSFMKIESMELLLPSSGAPAHKVDANFGHIVLRNDGTISFGKRTVDPRELGSTLKTLFSANPDQRIVILAADRVTLQTMVTIMDMVYLSGGKSVYIKAWHDKPGQPATENPGVEMPAPSTATPPPPAL